MSVNTLDPLREKIQQKTVVAGVIGLGYVGLPLSLSFLRKGIRVTGFDLDSEKVEKLGRGESYIKHIGNEELSVFVEQGSFQATTDFGRLQHSDVFVICVPTPLTSTREPDLKFVVATAGTIDSSGEYDLPGNDHRGALADS